MNQEVEVVVISDHAIALQPGQWSETLSLLKEKKERKSSRVWWFMPIIPALWEAKAGKSQGQEFKTCLANMVKPHLY